MKVSTAIERVVVVVDDAGVAFRATLHNVKSCKLKPRALSEGELLDYHIPFNVAIRLSQ